MIKAINQPWESRKQLHQDVVYSKLYSNVVVNGLLKRPVEGAAEIDFWFQ